MTKNEAEQICKLNWELPLEGVTILTEEFSVLVHGVPKQDITETQCNESLVV